MIRSGAGRRPNTTHCDGTAVVLARSLFCKSANFIAIMTFDTGYQPIIS